MELLFFRCLSMRRPEQIKFSFLVLAAAIGLFASPGYSNAEAEEHHAGHHDAHVHGEAELNMIFNDNIVQIEFKSPAANLLGFEHQPKNDEERAVVRAVEDSLRDSARLFVFQPITSCKPGLVDLDLPFSHSPTHSDEHGDESAHSDIFAKYQFICDQGERPRAVDLKNLLSKYPGLEKIDAQWVFENSQGAAVLSSGKAIIHINKP